MLAISPDIWDVSKRQSPTNHRGLRMLSRAPTDRSNGGAVRAVRAFLLLLPHNNPLRSPTAVAMGSFHGWVGLAFLAALVALAYEPLHRRLTVLGVLREPARMAVAEGDLVVVEDTMQCEDLHLHALSNTLFTACEDSIAPRFSWFPPLANFQTPSYAQGSIHVIDPKTFKSQRLALENFSGPLITHGIDVVPDPEAPETAVYIFVVNHPPNPEFWEEGNKDAPKARSQVELFHHVLGSGVATHVRSVRHPLITTPNDVYAEGSRSFYVTNDHRYREGLLRRVEDVVAEAQWSTTVHVHISDLQATQADAGLTASVALTGVQTNNGIGRGATPDEILVTSSHSGLLYLLEPAARESGEATDDKALKPLEAIYLNSTIDNPSYYSDPYRTEHDASGYILPGLARAVDVPRTRTDAAARDGVVVWHVQPGRQPTGRRWETRLLFEDDGSRIRSASAAVLVPIDPVLESGTKRGWLFVTGYFAESMVAVKVDL
ncbi:hypothetical protein VTN02DRAFT_2674 [Thermoascus thermophilus]